MFFEKISSGWQLAKQSFQVLRLDKELLVFPLMSGIACLLVIATFAGPMWATGFFAEIKQKHAAGDDTAKVIASIVLFGYYVLNYFVIIYFNSALVACAIIRFRGGNPTVKDGLTAASARLPQILGWAVFAATVGMILKNLEQRSQGVSSFVANMFGMTWSAITYFVVPVIVVERAGPIKAIERSTSVLKKSWGESLAANFGVGGITFLLVVVASVPLVLGVVAITAKEMVLGGIGIAIGAILLLVIALVSSALHAIIVSALYLFATEGSVPAQFDNDLLENAFARK